MKRIVRAVTVAAMLAGATVWAQPGGRSGMGGPPGGMSASMAKLFGDNKVFSAKVEANVQDPSQSGPMSMEMNMSMLDGESRVDADISKAKGGSMSPGLVAQIKAMGMDKSVYIIRPDKKMTYNLFPGVKAYVATAMTDKQVADAMDKSKIEKTRLGEETIDGHPCEKNKLVITDDNGEKHEVLVWNATDQKNFPLRIQMDEKGSKSTMNFKDVKLEKPDAAQFDPPTDFTKYDSFMSLAQAEGMKRAGAGRPGQSPK